MRRPRPRTLIGVGVPILVVMAFLAVWAFDTSSASDGSLRNVELAGRDLSNQDEDEVAAEVAREAVEFASTEVRIKAGSTTIESTASELGLGIDQEATVDAVLDEGRDGTAVLRPLAWAKSFVTPYEAEVSYDLRPDTLALVLSQKEGDSARQPVEPELVASPESVGIKKGVAGRALDPDQVSERLLDAARAGEDPITIDVEPQTRDPQISDAEAQAVADEAQGLTDAPLTVTVAGKTATFDVPELRSWIGSRTAADGLELTFDQERIDAVLHEAIGSLGEAEPRSASVTLVNGAPQVVPAVVGQSCCAEDAPATIIEALRAGQGAVEIEAVTEEPELTTEEAVALGIKEPVGTTTEWKGQPQVKSFTTYFDAGQPRVTNIQRIAALVQGALVLPGETFSVNGRVGQRTVEKGFVEAGAIANGVHVDEVGGGVSQFATTMFNAVFFAGLPFEEYQAHSEHFGRYPRGREATMGWENPDLAWTNNTPYGILVWTSWTDTSVTVTLYSTQYAFGQQTGQIEEPSGTSCTRVTTTRTITYPDGRTENDTVAARYRNGDATSCG